MGIGNTLAIVNTQYYKEHPSELLEDNFPFCLLHFHFTPNQADT